MKKILTMCLFVFAILGCTAEPDPISGDDELMTETADESAEAAEVPPTEDIEEPTAVPEQPTLTPPPLEEPEPTIEVAPTEDPTEEPTEMPAVELVEESEVVQPKSEPMTFVASDGLEIQTTYATPGGTAPFPGIILLHMLGRNRQVWEQTGVIDAFRLQGYAVLAIDMRGHGETGGERDWVLAREDFSMIYDQFVALPEVDETKTAVMGGSIGANMSLSLAVDRPAIQTTILLSPGLDYRGVATDDLMTQYGERPIFIVASEEDGYAADSSRTLTESATNGTLELFNGAGHGTNMFSREPALLELILNWLEGGL